MPSMGPVRIGPSLRHFPMSFLCVQHEGDRQDDDCSKEPRLLERNESKLGEMFIAGSISRFNGGSV
jgi:hypothetical protein